MVLVPLFFINIRSTHDWAMTFHNIQFLVNEKEEV
jgi:hypothetical protein